MPEIRAFSLRINEEIAFAMQEGGNKGAAGVTLGRGAKRVFPENIDHVSVKPGTGSLITRVIHRRLQQKA